MDLSFRSAKIVIRCADLNASRAFYTDVLGLQVTGQWDEPEGRGVIVTLGDRAPGALIEMYEMAADRRFDPRFRERFPNDKIDLQLEIASVDDWAGRLRGRWPFEGPQDLPWGQRWIKLRDPYGLLIAIYTYAGNLALAGLWARLSAGDHSGLRRRRVRREAQSSPQPAFSRRNLRDWRAPA